MIDQGDLIIISFVGNNYRSVTIPYEQPLLVLCCNDIVITAFDGKHIKKLYVVGGYDAITVISDFKNSAI